MNKFTRRQFWEYQTQIQQRGISREQQMGLFTFYRQQQDEQNFAKTHFTNIKAHNVRKPKTKSRFKFEKVDKSPRKTELSQEEKNQDDKSENCELFLKNIAVKTHKPNYRNDKDSSYSNKWFQNLQTKSIEMRQKSNIYNPESNKLRQSTEIKKFDFDLKPQKGFIPRPLKKIEELMQICTDKIALNKKKSQDKSEKSIDQHEKTVKSIVVQEEILKLRDSKQGRNNSRKVCRIVLKQEDGQKHLATPLQKSFLKKIRANHSSQLKTPEIQKETSSSKQLQSLHDQNKKYFRNLIDTFYLTHSQINQAGKMLRETLKFPTFIINKCHLKTDGNASPIQKEADGKQRTGSWSKDHQRELKDKSKQGSPEKQQLRTNLNERFRFLLRKQKTINHHLDRKKLKFREVSVNPGQKN